MSNLLSKFCFADLCVQYCLEKSTGVVGLELLPVGWQGRRQPKNQAIERTSPDGREKLIVAHIFDETTTIIRIDLDGKF